MLSLSKVQNWWSIFIVPMFYCVYTFLKECFLRKYLLYRIIRYVNKTLYHFDDMNWADNFYVDYINIKNKWKFICFLFSHSLSKFRVLMSKENLHVSWHLWEHKKTSKCWILSDILYFNAAHLHLLNKVQK